MGSVIDYIECSHCGGEAYDDYYYKTGEEYINCNNCGYHYSATIINKNKLLNELTNDDWKIKEIKNPYGSYRIKHYDSVATQCGGLTNIDEYNNIKEWVEKELNDIEYFSISRFVDGEIKVEYIIDNEPKINETEVTAEDNDELPF